MSDRSASEGKVGPGKLKVAILGSGNIGTDLLIKVLRSPLLDCTLFIGRHPDSRGIAKAKGLGVKTSVLGIDALMEDPHCCDLVFDATSAIAHVKHWPVLERMGKFVIDLTPSGVGEMLIPAVNIEHINDYRNVNMVSCGGQASIPLAYLIGKTYDKVDYIEVVSSIASQSAGHATRLNIDEYVETTEAGIRKYSGCNRAKTILILNPARPCINMQVTVSAKVGNADVEKLRAVVGGMVIKIQSYVPGYQMIVPPVFEDNRIVIMVRVTGIGDYLPSYAGNLDIINASAIATAEAYAAKRTEGK